MMPLLAVAALASALGLPAFAQGVSDIDPTGGLRAKGLAPGLSSGPADTSVGGATREELVRSWDLDGNGIIDAAEETIARGRIRRERRDLDLQRSIDPLTGRLRIEAPATGEAEPAADRESVPSPNPLSTGSATAPPSPPAATPRPRSAARQPVDRGDRATSITGGVRAGAPAARQGYGSLVPRGDLNAGRSVRELPRGGAPGGSRAASGGGLVPSLRRPMSPGRVAAPQPPTQQPARPRVTAEDMGGF